MKKPPIIPLLTVAFFVILMTSLGFWQLRRTHEKEQLLELLADDKITQIQHKAQIKSLPQYANIELNGHFLNAPQLLLDNQIESGKQGYHVFTPFLADDLDLYIMVNRGWIAKKPFDKNTIMAEAKPTKIAGKINLPPQVGIQLGEIVLNQDKDHQVVTYFDKEKISAFLHETLCKNLSCLVSNKVLLLDKDQLSGFKREWKPVIMPPSKHMAYAVQWFSMTIVLILIFVYWLRKS